MRSRWLVLWGLLAAACGDASEGALDAHDPLHPEGVIIPDTPFQLPPAPTPKERVLYPVPPPPFTEGVFPCSRCHLGGEPVADARPAMPHSKHLERDLVCADCHAPDDAKADPKVPPASLCFDCHEEDLSKESEAVRAYFAAIRQADGSYQLPRRWKTQDTIANHTGHAAAGIECAECHGEPGNGPFVKPKSVILMNRCQACHEERKAPNECATCHREIREPYHDIVLQHAEDQRGCLDCHHPEDRDALRLANGSKVPFQESYRLCGQCHGTQYRDWKQGLHGKRSGRWDGRKEYLLCVHCHRNPHAPAFPKMEPLPPPTRPENIR